MTICIAAICEEDKIVGAADRLLTAGDIKYEPEREKIITLTNSIVAMIAGDAAFCWQVLQDVSAVVERRISANPNRWLMVREVSEMYRLSYNATRLRLAENAVLAPLGLDHETYLKEQSRMDRELILRIAVDLKNFQPPQSEIIIAGVDPTGPHIYVADSASVWNADFVGFAAIGSGGWHAKSRFMYARHAPRRGFPETLLLTYSAKKHAEVAPHIGGETDMVVIGPALGSALIMGGPALRSIASIHESTQRELQRIETVSQVAITGLVEKLRADSSQRQQEGGLTELPPDDDETSEDAAPDQEPS